MTKFKKASLAVVLGGLATLVLATGAAMANGENNSAQETDKGAVNFVDDGGSDNKAVVTTVDENGNVETHELQPGEQPPIPEGAQGGMLTKVEDGKMQFSNDGENWSDLGIDAGEEGMVSVECDLGNAEGDESMMKMRITVNGQEDVRYSTDGGQTWQEGEPAE